MDFRSGAEAAAAQAASSHTTKFYRLSYLSLPNEGDTGYLRMLSGHGDGEGFITVHRHGGSPTRDAPAGFTGKWPASLPAVCRNEEAFGRGFYEDCFLCNRHRETGDDRKYKPTARNFALAIRREPLMRDGRQVGFGDASVEVEIDGEKKFVPDIILLDFAWSNFFLHMANTYLDNGTWTANDHQIRRMGMGKDTTYTVTKADAVTSDGEFFGTAMTKHEANPTEFPKPSVDDIFDPGQAAHAGPYLSILGVTPEDLATKYGGQPYQAYQDIIEKTVIEKSSDDFYAQFFDTRWAQPERKSKDDDKTGPEQATPPPAAAASEPNASDLSDLAARVQGSGYAQS